MIDESEFLDLFIPGPVNVSKENREKMTYPMIAHRSSTMSDLHNDIAEYLGSVVDHGRGRLITGGFNGQDSCIALC